MFRPACEPDETTSIIAYILNLIEYEPFSHTKTKTSTSFLLSLVRGERTQQFSVETADVLASFFSSLTLQKLFLFISPNDNKNVPSQTRHLITSTRFLCFINQLNSFTSFLKLLSMLL